MNTVNQLITITIFKKSCGVFSPFSVRIAKKTTIDRKMNTIINTIIEIK
jgi:hypothetical protein